MFVSLFFVVLCPGLSICSSIFTFVLEWRYFCLSFPPEFRSVLDAPRRRPGASAFQPRSRDSGDGHLCRSPTLDRRCKLRGRDSKTTLTSTDHSRRESHSLTRCCTTLIYEGRWKRTVNTDETKLQDVQGPKGVAPPLQPKPLGRFGSYLGWRCLVRIQMTAL